jgi:hypothetical protein
VPETVNIGKPKMVSAINAYPAFDGFIILISVEDGG